MAVLLGNSDSISNISSSATDDPLLPWLRSIREALQSQNFSQLNNFSDFDALVASCINTFKSDSRYRVLDFTDSRTCTAWEMDGCSDYERIFKEVEENRICLRKALLYESFALLLEAKGRLIDACMIYHLGISRNAEPLGRLKKAQVLFLERMSDIVSNGSFEKIKNDISAGNVENFVNPWSIATIKTLLQKMNSQVVQYEGYHPSTKACPGKLALSSLKSARNKTIDIGSEKYQIKGCAGHGGFVQVFKAYANGNPDDVLVLKIQKPPFPWEFYMYRQLDMRIPEKERKSFVFAHRLHLYSHYSILVSDYFAHGTLQDAINSYLVIGGHMEEVLCIYYTIEMLRILETLHDASMIHGDFKPDNLLIRYSRDDPTENQDDFRLRTVTWCDQGYALSTGEEGLICLSFLKARNSLEIVKLLASVASRCKRISLGHLRWTCTGCVSQFTQCFTVHTWRLRNEHPRREPTFSPNHITSGIGMLISGRICSESCSTVIQLKITRSCSSLLGSQDYMCSDPKLIKKLKQLLVKQRISLCSA